MYRVHLGGPGYYMQADSGDFVLYTPFVLEGMFMCT